MEYRRAAIGHPKVLPGRLLEQQPEAMASALWNLAYDAGYGAGRPLRPDLCPHRLPGGVRLTGALILAEVPVAWRERTALAGVARPG